MEAVRGVAVREVAVTAAVRVVPAVEERVREIRLVVVARAKEVEVMGTAVVGTVEVVTAREAVAMATAAEG